MSIKKNILDLRKEISNEIDLVAVSKTRSIDEINEAYIEGQRKFGENRVQEIVEKFNELPDDIEWHMIGYLRKNKVKYISNFISLIHSLDRISLAKEIDKNAKKSNRVINCLIQLKISKEESKFGLEIDQLDSFSQDLKNYSNIKIIGLMGMASFTSDKEVINKEFSQIKSLFDRMSKINSNIKILSIGMSGDYKLALKKGSNMIRVGSKIFGKRNY